MIALVNEYQAVLDTCVLAPMPLCDTLLRLAEEPGVYVPRWSGHIFEELERVLERFGYSDSQIQRRLTTMREHFAEAEVTGFEALIPAMTNHPKDRHILAAAVRCGANAILTTNVKDFPKESLEPYGLDLLHPDDFLVHQYHLNQYIVLEKLRQQGKLHPEGLPGLLRRLQPSSPTFVALVGKDLG